MLRTCSTLQQPARPSRYPRNVRWCCAANPKPASQSQQKTFKIPTDAEQVGLQALGASQRAYADGVKRQRFELLLPLIGASDIDDWPGGVRQQFKAVLPMVEAMLQGLRNTQGLEGRLAASIWDQGDAVGAWISDAICCVVFPTPETLARADAAHRMQGLPLALSLETAQDAAGDKLTLLVNPQWQEGQVVSDFGWGQRKRSTQEFLAGFQDVYHLSQYRISGDEIRLLRCYPGQWQVHLVSPGGVSDCVHSQDTRPSYKELAAVLKGITGSASSKTWAQRLRSEFAFNRDSLRKQ